MDRTDGAKRRGLNRRVIVERALELGDAEGLEAVSLRRLASELGVTPMALYRHVNDKQDLVNAMYEAIVENFDLQADLRPGLKWTNQLRQSLMNVIALHDRPVALPLAIAYSGSGSAAIWRMYEDGLGILLGAGFTRREAVALNRMLAILVAGYLMLIRQAPLPEPDEVAGVRKRFELELLSLPRAQYSNVVASARELVDAQFSDPQLLVTGLVDFLVGGVEARLMKRKRRPQPERSTQSARPTSEVKKAL
jgi:AcrR family transcriptional regulator